MKAVAYTRVSTEKQAAEGLSLDEQVRQVEAHIAAQGWDHAGTFVEAGVSGRRDDRPELNKLLALVGGQQTCEAQPAPALGQPSIDVVVIPKLDRLGRSTLHLLQVCADLKAAGVRLVSLGDAIDTSTAAGQMLLEILAAVASFESARIGERVASVSTARAASGKVHGRCPYGYVPGADGVIVQDPVEAAVVRRIFHEYAIEGRSQHEITWRLNRDGVRAQRGGAWRQASVSKLLANPVFAGTVRLNGQEYGGEHEPIVDADLWHKAEAIRAAGTRTRRGRRPVANHVLSAGLLRCGCGSTMNAITKPTRTPGRLYEVYACSGRASYGADHCAQTPVRREPIDRAIFTFFTTVALDLDATKAAVAEHHDAKLAEVDALRAQADREAHRTADALSRIEADYTAGSISADQWSRMDDKLTTGLAAAQAQAARLEDQRRTVQAEHAAIDAEAAILDELTALRATVAGQVRDGHESVDAFRAALRRTFESFQLLGGARPFGSSGVDGATVWPHDDLVLPSDLSLLPLVKDDAIRALWDDQGEFPALRRAVLALRDSDASGLTR